VEWKPSFASATVASAAIAAVDPADGDSDDGGFTEEELALLFATQQRVHVEAFLDAEGVCCGAVRCSGGGGVVVVCDAFTSRRVSDATAVACARARASLPSSLYA
jgi:hypothetical protein